MTHLGTENTSYGQKKSQESNCQFNSRPLKVKNHPISLCAGGVPHVVKKLLMRAITLFMTSPQSEVFTQSYRLPKLQGASFWKFRDFHLGVDGQNDIWVLALWPST
jgi:hypothetical protein